MAPNELKSTGGVKVSPIFAQIYTTQIILNNSIFHFQWMIWLVGIILADQLKLVVYLSFKEKPLSRAERLGMMKTHIQFQLYEQC